MSFEAFMHWFWTAIFAGLGLLLLANPSGYRNIEAYFCQVRLPYSLKDRLMEAAERRKMMENLSLAPTRASGALVLLLAAVAAFIQISPTVLYAILCVGFSGFLAVAYLQLRNRHSKRVAPIDVRTPLTAVPAYGYGLAVLSALFPTVDIGSASLRVPAVIAILSAFAIVSISWRLATMPALLAGDDLPVERFVDDRLRFIRTAATLNFAPGVIFVYFGQTVGQGSHLRDLFSPAAAMIFVGLSITFTIALRRGPSVEELDSWQTLA